MHVRIGCMYMYIVSDMLAVLGIYMLCTPYIQCHVSDHSSIQYSIVYFTITWFSTCEVDLVSWWWHSVKLVPSAAVCSADKDDAIFDDSFSEPSRNLINDT